MRASVSWYEKKTLENAYQLLDFTYIKYITNLDVSDCVMLEGISLVECMQGLPQLKSFVYRYCKLVTEYHLMKISQSNKELLYIDGTHAAKVSYSSALCVLGSLHKLEKFAVMPKPNEGKSWGKLLMQFSNVTFGYTVKAVVPYGGNIAVYKQVMESAEL